MYAIHCCKYRSLSLAHCTCYTMCSVHFTCYCMVHCILLHCMCIVLHIVYTSPRCYITRLNSKDSEPVKPPRPTTVEQIPEEPIMRTKSSDE